MDKPAAINLIEQTFGQPFDELRFKNFVRNLFNQIDESKAGTWQGNYIPEAFRDQIKQVKRLGTYTDPAGLDLDILIVYLRSDSALERARTMQRNYVAHYLKTRGEKEAAVVAFTGDDPANWRFSLIKMEYHAYQDGDTQKVKIAAELTPARRYSFLVGQHEPHHTASRQLLPILQDTQQNPTLAALEEAFNLETVTKEFFEKYKELFLQLKDELDTLVATDPAIHQEFTQKQVDPANFAKKLLGQLVFLYFLQKKGWLGVQPGQPWGSGPTNFLRHLFEQGGYTNFFNDRLEPLFYEALALERPHSFYPPLNCQIPFLNGGLFEPLHHYDWQTTDILLANVTLGRIFDTFDLYNFTVREAEPLEKEVAVDPEMLGKVFENLLEVTDRKSKGAFYTPREIVHYMCQESLINYLDATLNPDRAEVLLPGQPKQASLFGDDPPEQLGLTARVTPTIIPRAELEALIRHGERFIEHDAATSAKPAETRDYRYKLPESIRANAAALDQALARIKICDLAIGSGAFPVGMMQEIVRARTVLTTYLTPPSNSPRWGEDTASPPSGGTEGGPERTPYHFKRHAILESLYGVDIDPSAVDIAKLRLWLSLVVDEADYRTIKPLPNLDYKIVCGNALLGVPQDLSNWQDFAGLEALKPAYFEATDPAQKQQLRQQIDGLIARLTHNQDVFDAKIYFSEVFHHRGGFDVVIGNPPYVRHELIREQKPALQLYHPQVYQGTADLYVYFYSQALHLLRPNGFLTFITGNKFMRAGYGQKLRQFLVKQTTLKILIDFGDLPVFDATAYPCIVLTQKAAPPSDTTVSALTVVDVEQIKQITPVMAQHAWPLPVKQALTADGWRLENPTSLNLLTKLRRAGTPLGEYVNGRFYIGLKTAFNKAYIIDEQTRLELIRQDPNSAKIIKPYLRGRGVKRWSIEPINEYLILIQSSSDQNNKNPWANSKNESEARKVFRESYPAIYALLAGYEEDLKKRSDQGRYWWELRSCAYYSEFDVPKLIWPDIAKRCEFTIDSCCTYLDMTLFTIPIEDYSLLAILNSSVTEWLMKQISSSIQNDFIRFKRIYLSQIPIPAATPEQQAAIEGLVQQILAAKQANPQANVAALEAEINALVYQLYGLTAAEISLVEGRG
jgi:methylase of polypeptide subunit release factors